MTVRCRAGVVRRDLNSHGDEVSGGRQLGEVVLIEHGDLGFQLGHWVLLDRCQPNVAVGHVVR